jgi:hypothetical protein
MEYQSISIHSHKTHILQSAQRENHFQKGQIQVIYTNRNSTSLKQQAKMEYQSISIHCHEMRILQSASGEICIPAIGTRRNPHCSKQQPKTESKQNDKHQVARCKNEISHYLGKSK